MTDPNLPQDMQQQPPPQRRKKQLPSLQGGGSDESAPGTATVAGAPDSRPRRRTLPPMGATPPAANAEGDAAAAAVAPKPRRKKRPPTAGGGTELDSSPDHGTAPISAQQQLLPNATDADSGTETTAAVGRQRRKKRGQPAAAAAAAPQVEEDERQSPEGVEAMQGLAVTRTRQIDVEGMPLAKALETVREDVVTKGNGAGRVNFGADLTDGGAAGDDAGPAKRVADEDDDAGQLGGGGGRLAGESNMSDTIFWQTQDARTFKAEKIDKYQQRQEEERKERERYLEGVIEEDTSNRTLKCAIGFTKVYNYMGTVLLGLMPGFAILHTIYVWSLSSSYISFLASYTTMSSPMPILYYVVLTLLVLSVLDRYDTGKLDRQSCLECGSFRHAGMVILLYVPAYVVSNAMYPTDQWIRRYTNNATAYAGQSTGDSLVQSFRIMDAVRTACMVLGWLVIAFNPQFNKLATNLETELDDLIGEDQRIEMGTAGTVKPGTATAKSVAMA